jgi:hypothetical protein
MTDPSSSEFWMIWNEHRSAPTVKHRSDFIARQEAERLARQSPGESFHVLRLVGTVKVADVIWTLPRVDDLPF